MQTLQKCRIERSYLAAVLTSAARFRSTKKSYLPILSTVLLRSDADRIYVAGTDLDDGAVVSAPAQGDAFAVAFNPSAALDWLAQTKGGAIQVSLPDPSRIEFASNGRSRITLLASPADDFPTWPDVESEGVFRVQTAAFVEAVKAVLPFAPKPSRRSWHVRTPAVHLLVQGQQLVVAACDGARFHRRDVPLIGDASDDEFQFAVSSSALGNLLKLIAENDFSHVELAVSKNEKHVSFHAGSDASRPLFAINAKLLDARLNIEKVQSNFDTTAGSFSVETKVLSRALRRLARIAKGDGNRVELDVEPGIVAVRARSAELGVALEEVPADTAGLPTQIAFDQKQLLEIIKTTKAERITVEYQPDPRKAVRIAGVLIVPVEAFAVEEARRLAKRAAAEAVAAKADVAALAGGVEDQFREWQQRSVFADVTQAVFTNLDQVFGNHATWPEELQKLPHDLKAQLCQQVANELVQRGVLRQDGTTWHVQPDWANAQLAEGEAERHEQARTALRDGVKDAFKKVRSADKLAYADVLLEWHCGAQDQTYPYRGSDLSFSEASDIRSRFTAVLNAVTAEFEPQEQGGDNGQ